jgi:hypothetical protein
MPPKDHIRLISGILGLVAIGCVLAIGSYIVAWCWNIYSTGLDPSFLIPTEITWVCTLASALLLIYGSLKILKKSTLKGGFINLIAGVEVIPLFLYSYFYLRPLPQFEFIGTLLFLPSILSGIIGLASFRSSKT